MQFSSPRKRGLPDIAFHTDLEHLAFGASLSVQEGLSCADLQFESFTHILYLPVSLQPLDLVS